MKKLFIIVILTLFLSASFSNVAFARSISLKTETSNIWIVDDEGDGDYKCIQCAINHAEPGDKIYVYSGAYKERIQVKKTLELIGISQELENGNDVGKPIIDGSNKGNVVELYADGCIVTCFNIVNGGYYKSEGNGLVIISSHNQVITNNTFKNNFIAISFARDRISRLLKINNFPRNCTFRENEFQFNVFGLYVTKANNHTIENNSCQNSGIIFFGEPLQVLNSNFSNNTVNGKPIYLHTSEKDTIISHPDAGQVIINDCHNCTIENLTIHNTSIGIIIGRSSNLIIRNNTLKNIHRGGISLHADNSEVYNNTFYNCSYGCYLEGGTDFYLHHNNFIKCFKHDQFVISYVKKHQKFMSSKNVCYDSNYWDNWIGLKHPSLWHFPKVIIGFLNPLHKSLNIFPIFKLDWHPASEPYE